MTDGTNLSKLTMRELLELKARVKAARPIVKYRSMVREVCALPPEKSKEILCQMAKDVEEESIKGGWQKIVLNAIKTQME
jgi:hypothetical protein